MNFTVHADIDSLVEPGFVKMIKNYTRIHVGESFQ